MKLEQLRRELDTDARQRCQAQEETIKNLIDQNKRLSGLLREREDDIRALQNRCFVFTRGTFCSTCLMRSSCSATHGKERQADA